MLLSHRYFVSARSIIHPISHTVVLHTMRTCCNDQDDTRSRRLLFQIGHCHLHNYRLASGVISNCARIRGQRLFAIMRIFGNSLPSHWHDSIEWCNVSMTFFQAAEQTNTEICCCVYSQCFSVLSIALWLLPDIVMFITTIVAYVILRKLTAPPPIEDVEENASPSTSAAADTDVDDGPSYTFENYTLLKRTGKSSYWLRLIILVAISLIPFNFSSNFLCDGNAFDCCNTATVRPKCRLLHHFLANGNDLGIIQRNRSRLCHYLPNSGRSVGGTYQRIVDISNALAAGISRCQ